MPGVEIRDATDADLKGLSALEERTFASDRMAERSFRRLLARPSARVRVAVDSPAGGVGGILGYHLVLMRKNSAVARLYSLAVDARRRGGGLGERLLADAEAVAAGARRSFLRLEVHERNRPAIALYERRGFRPIGRYAAYYADRADALRYEKPLEARGARKKPGT
jgi:ribosomal protein S18 acetylase RimI-like enzyme